MSYNHGIKVSEVSTSVPTPAVATCGIPFVIGTAPVQSVGGKVNQPVLCKSYAEAVATLGYSNDWDTYSLCEVIYSHFKLYGMSPVVFLNVLDPDTMKEAVTAAEMDVVEKQIRLPIDAIADTVVIKAQGGTGSALEPDTDYCLTYSGENLIIEVLPEGTVYSATKLNVAYSKVKASSVTTNSIIGGYDASANTYTGLECINQVLPMYGFAPDIIIAPGWSHDKAVAAAMAIKAVGINSLFPAKAIVDVDTTSAGAGLHTDVPAWKKSNNINDKNQIVCWPMVQKDGKTYHMSTHAAGLIAQVDLRNGSCPYESPSNKALMVDSIVTDGGVVDGKHVYNEVILELSAANTLNANGIVTALNWLNGFILWGNFTACYPDNTDVKDYFICVSRMFGWVTTSIIRTFWSKIDKPMSKLLVDSIVDAANYWLNGLYAEGKIYGGRVEYKAEENEGYDDLSKIKLHVYITPPSPAQEFDFVLEYEPDYASKALE